MALLQRTRILPQQRLDLPDFRNIEDFVCADFKAQFKNIWTGENFVLKGFESTGLGTNELNIVIAGSALIVGADDGTMFIGAPSVADTVTDALTPAATNYVEISIEQDTGGADSRAFWDPTAAAGQGGEFSQIVDTFIFTKIKLNINTSNFTGSPDMVPVCEVDVNGSGIITDIRDARNMFWRLGRRGQTNYTFPWVSRTEPPVSQFDGADKDITSEKAWKDAIMSRILELDGGNFWFENSGVSLVGGFRNTGLSMVTSQSTDAKWAWDGSLLTLTDSNVTPLDADVIAAIRLLDSTANLLLTRQDGTGGSTAFALADGDVLWVELPDPLANVNYNAIGLTASNFRVSPRGSVPNDSNTFWLAYRDGANVYLRFFGELQPGEDVEISDNVNENILAAIGIATETDMPNYTSNNIVVDGTSLVAAVSALDAAAGISGIQANQDRSLKLIEGGTWAVNMAGDTVSWSADAFIDIPEVTRVSNRILVGNVTLPNANSVAYVEVNRASGPATLTVNVADIDALIPTENTVIIARRVTAGILVGRTCFLLKAGEYLELDGALAEINRKLGQLKLRPHETSPFKARIDAADITQLDDSILSQIIGDFLLKFDGAVINFQTGVINKADDVTALGINFTPFSIPVGEYFWYGVSLIPSNVLADNTQEAQVQIDLASAANASASAALKPVISGDIKLGAIQIFNNAGSLEISETRKLGVGSGSGSGSGDASAVDTALRDRFSLNNFLFLTENIFRTDKSTKVDMSSTGEFSPAKKAFGFSAAAQTLVSSNHLDADFLDDGIDVSEVEFYLFWLAGFIDTAATYAVSRDGGVNWQTATMERIGQTNAYRVHHTFTDEVTQQTLALVAPTGVGTALNATTAQQLSSELVISDTSVVKFLNIELNRAAAAVGNLFVQIVKDDTGVPSTDPADIVSESDAISIAGLGTGNISLVVDMPDVVLTPATYHVVLRTDSAYKAGTMDLSWRSGAGTDGADYNGTIWTGGTSTKAFEAEGRPLDLRVRVTSSAGDVFVEGYGVYYDSSIGIQPSSTRKIQKFVFSGDENRTDFACNFQVDPYIVTVHDVYRGQSYVPDSASDSPLRVDGNTLKFATDTFDFPGETIILIVRQLEGNGVDVSQENSQKIFEIEQNLIDIGDELASISDSMILPKIAAPFTTIQNRALMPDLSQDLFPRLGVDRINTQSTIQISDEFGPNGEPVFTVPNDKFNQVRFVGAGVSTSGLNAGPRVALSLNDFVEVTFYGTGLSLRTIEPIYNLGVSVDGGGESIISATGSTVLAPSNYAPNVIVNLASNLSLGMHTVKVRVNSGSISGINGFDILTENTSGLIQLPPGSQLYKGKRLTHSALETTSYNSGFETGVLGTRGGRVLIYQKSDGSIAKAVTPTDSTALFMASANHANEEISRIYNFREFGAGRTDDFSILALNGNVSAAFTLDDAVTTLVGGAIDTNFNELVRLGNAGASLTIIFVGTGIDYRIPNLGGTVVDNIQLYVDGVNVGTVTGQGRSERVRKVASGLPYGTHTLRIENLSGTPVNTEHIREFIIYQPKTPTLPNGAVAVGSYNIMANYSGANITGTTTAGNIEIPVGTLFKAPSREYAYVGANWQFFPLDATSLPGFTTTTLTNNSQPLSLEFFGTGVVVHLGASVAGTYDFTVNIDGALNASGVVRSNASNLGGGSYRSTASTNAYQPCRVEFTGLTLGRHRITIQRTGGTGNFTFQGLHIITPIHSPKLNGPFVVQNTMNIGSQGILDMRKFSKKDIDDQLFMADASGVFSTPSTSSTVFVPQADLACPVYLEKDSLVRINFDSALYATALTPNIQIQAFVDGKAVGHELWHDVETATGQPQTTSGYVTLRLSKGFHFVYVMWRCNTGTAASNITFRGLTVERVS